MTWASICRPDSWLGDHSKRLCGWTGRKWMLPGVGGCGGISTSGDYAVKPVWELEDGEQQQDTALTRFKLSAWAW